VKERGRDEIYRARIVIGADGSKRCGRWAGLDIAFPAREWSLRTTCSKGSIQSRRDLFAVSMRLRPWLCVVFPKAVAVRQRRSGLVAFKTNGRNAREHLDA